MRIDIGWGCAVTPVRLDRIDRGAPHAIIECAEEKFFDRVAVNVHRHLEFGAAGIERAAQDPPDLMRIKLGLPDLSGEATASILKQMPKTMDIPLILYTPPGERPKDASIQKICEKAKVKNLVESNDPALFLEKVEVFFRNESIRSHL